MTTSGPWGSLAARRETCNRCNASLVGAKALAFAAIWREQDGLRREDLCAACFDRLEERPYYHWRCAPRTAPAKTRKARQLDALEGLFERLGETESDSTAEGEAVGSEQQRQAAGLRYLLALELVRRKRLELVDLAREGGADCLVVRASGTAEWITIAAPALGSEELERLGRELAEELGLGGEPV